MLTHLRHELAHAILALLLDDDLLHAYTDGEAIKLADKILHSMFPRFYFILQIIRKSRLNVLLLLFILIFF